MLSLNETVERTPVHVFYLGSEAQFLDELETLDKPVSDPENLEFTCCRDARDLISHLYAFETPHKYLNIVVFGLLRHLEGSYGSETPECVLRHWSAVLNTGVPYLQFGDTATSDLVDTLLSKTKLESNELQAQSLE